MLIQQKLIRLTNSGYKPKQFVIERFYIPEELTGIHIHLKMPADIVKCVFVYDQQYQLRAEYGEVCTEENIRIYNNEEETSFRAVPGPINKGEWLIAIEVDILEDNQTWEIMYFVEGIQKATTFDR